MDARAAGGLLLGLGAALTLLRAGAAGDCSVSVSQPPVLEVAYTQGAVTVPCSFSTARCPPEPPASLWFRLGAEQPESLCANGRCTGEAGKFTVQDAPAPHQASLTVNRLAPNDSAIYICGVAVPHSADPRAKQTGAGTVLVVRGPEALSPELRRLLVALLSLLSLYVAGVLVTFIILSKSKSNRLRHEDAQGPPKKKSARRIFQEIAQELYSKRHVGTSQPPEKDNTYENRRVLHN